MSEWIKARITLHQDPIVVKQAAALGRTAYEIAYAWIVVWGWARSHTADGFIRDVDQATIDAIAGIPSFAQHAGRWLEIASDGVTLPNWDRHNSNGARERAQANERMSKIRAGKSRGDASALRFGDDSVALERNTSATRREEKREEITTTTTTTSGTYCADDANAPKAGGGGGGKKSPSDENQDLQATAQAMPSYISATQRMKLARQAFAFAATIDGATALDVVGYLDSLAKQTSQEARPGSFVNMLRDSGESIDHEHFAQWRADKPRRQLLHYLTNTPDGRKEWSLVYTDNVSRQFRNEQLAMQAYVTKVLAEQARGGAA